MINGMVLNPSEISRIKITSSENSIDNLVKEIKLRDKNDKSSFKIFEDSAEWRAIDKLDDVTDKYIDKPPKKRVPENSILSTSTPPNKDTYVNTSGIEELKRIQNSSFDLSKLIKLYEEINENWHIHNYFSVIALVRTILHHIAPFFGLANFEQVASNYSGGQSFKKSMQHLLNSSKNIADTHLHSQAQKNEVLPNNQQVDYRNGLNFYLVKLLS